MLENLWNLSAACLATRNLAKFDNDATEPGSRGVALVESGPTPVANHRECQHVSVVSIFEPAC